MNQNLHNKSSLGRKILIKNLIIPIKIGIYKHEKSTNQRVQLNLELIINENKENINDKIENVVCYEEIIHKVKKIASSKHLNLVETLAEKISEECLKIPECHTIKVKVEKLDVFDDIESVGIEIIRYS